MGRVAEGSYWENKIKNKLQMMSVTEENVLMIGDIPKIIQAACIQIATPVLKNMGVKYEMEDVYKELKVDHVSTLRQVRIIIKTIFSKSKEQDEIFLKQQQKLNESLFLNDVYFYQISHPNCWIKKDRHQMTDEFKICILDKKVEYNLTWSDVSRLLNIPEDTLKKFKNQFKEKDDNAPPPPNMLTEEVIKKMEVFFKSRNKKSTVKEFCNKHPDVLLDLKMDYRTFSKLLIRLGYVSPKGIFLNNTGLDRIKRFAPHSIWGSDGKNMTIVINGESFKWVWQCLIDYKTTVLVGGVINESETTANLLEAITRTKELTGVSPMAIVLDNRLSENLPPVKEYLNEMGIEIIKTFPGNSKSNGIIENNFKVFETWVMSQNGSININSKTPKELSLSIAQLLTEVFTQLRNLAPRKSLGGKSPKDIEADALLLSDKERSLIQEEIKALANRFKNELASPITNQAKQEALNKVMESLNPPSPDLFLKRMSPSNITGDILLQALAILETQKQKHPEKVFDHTYFGGIVHNLVNFENLRLLQINLDAAYKDHWVRLEKAITEKNLKVIDCKEKCEELLQEIFDSKIPAQRALVLLYLKNIFMYVSGKSIESLNEIKSHLLKKIEKAKLVPNNLKELVLRKIFEFDLAVKIFIASTTEKTQNTTQVFKNSFDKRVTI